MKRLGFRAPLLVLVAGILLAFGRTSAQAQKIIIFPICSSNADCDDGDPCTADRCRIFCSHSNACSDGNACTDDVCTPRLCSIFDPFCFRKSPFTCSFPADNSNTCDDGLKCTGTESCSAGTCLHSGDPCADDGDNNCADACNPATGACDSPVPDDTPCNNQQPCTQTDVCRGGSCVGLDPVLCNQPDECHGSGTCNERDGQCVFPLLKGAECTIDTQFGLCDAAGQCHPAEDLCGTSAAQCNGGPCCTASCRLRVALQPCGGEPPPCHTARTCDGRVPTCPDTFPVAGDATPCDDGVFCNGTDRCRAGACTEHETRPAGAECPLAAGSGVCDGAGSCVPAVCGNGMVEPGEDCDGEECCTSTCRFKGATELCGSETRSCHQHPLCNGHDAACPTDSRPSDEGSTCSDDNECTVEDTCRQGECTSGPAVCGVTTELRKNGKRKVTVLVACNSDQPAECEASLLAEVPTTSTTVAGSAPVLSEIAQPRTAKLVHLKKSALGFRSVLRLRLNDRGRELLQSDQVNARLEVTVHRGGQDFHPPASILRLLKARK